MLKPLEWTIQTSLFLIKCVPFLLKIGDDIHIGDLKIKINKFH
jgi:hypothetical protein